MFWRIFVGALAAFSLLFSCPASAGENPIAGNAATYDPALPLIDGEASPLVGTGKVVDSSTVASLLAANPGQEMIICLAGCKAGHGSILWQRERTRFVETIDGSSGLGLLRGTMGRASAVAKTEPEVALGTEAVVCIAGCTGPVGLVVWRGMRLAWIRDERKQDLMAALHRLGDRLAAQDIAREQAEASIIKSRAWVGAAAKDGLRAAFGAPAAQEARSETQAASLPASPRG